MKRKITLIAAILCLLSMAVTLGGCQLIDKVLGKEEQENRIATVEEQVADIERSIGDLRLTDTQLREYIDTLSEAQGELESENDALTARVGTTETKIAELETQKDSLSGRLTTAEGDIDRLEAEIDALDARIKALEESAESDHESISANTAKITALEASIATLSVDLAQLGTRIAALEATKDSLATKTWVEATFATLEQQNATRDDLNTVKTDLATLEGKHTEDISSLTTAIANAESGLKDWVNERFYTKSDIDGKLAILATKTDVSTLETDLTAAKTELTAAYKAAIQAAIEDHDGDIDGIREDMNNALTSYQNRIDIIENKISSIQTTLDDHEDRITELEKLQDEIDKLKADNEALAIRINCMSDKHVVDETKVEYEWLEGFSGCTVKLVCKHCGIERSFNENGISINGTVVTVVFNANEEFGGFKPKDQSANISDTTQMTPAVLKSFVKSMCTANGSVTLTLNPDADADIFAAIAGGISESGKGAGTVDLTISGATTIPDNAFKDRVELKSVRIGTGVETIGKKAFSGCSYLQSVTFGSDVKTIGEETFSICSSLTALTVGGKVETLGKSSFLGCTGLKTVTLGNSVTTIEDYAFQDCMNLESITFGKGITDLSAPEGIILNCDKLESIVFLAPLVAVNDDAIIIEPTNNIVLELAPGQKALDEDTFSVHYATETDLTGGSNVEFGGVRYHEVKVGVAIDARTMHADEITEAVKSAVMGGVTNISITFAEDAGTNELDALKRGLDYADNGTIYLTIDGITETTQYSDNSGIFHNCYKLAGVTLGPSVEKISHYTFRSCGYLVSVDLGNVKEIGNLAFYCTGITSVDLSGVEKIGQQAFEGTAIVSVTIPGTVRLREYDTYMFCECKSLTNVVIEEGVTMIVYGMFQNCDKLTTVNIPVSVTSIGNIAFENSAITDIYYAGTKAQWNALVGTNYEWNTATSEFNVHCSDGILTVTVSTGE